MPRTARKKSASDIYHILLRGINRQNIFEDEDDKCRFKETLQRYKKEIGFEIHAYCFMNNHIHLLIKVDGKQIETVMKKIVGSYVYYFNRKYDRTGHLFQDRFKSEPIESDAYFLACLRYIHRNPVKAKICKINEFAFSSYNEFVDKADLCDTEFALCLLGGKDNFVSFCLKDDDENCLDITTAGTISDEKAVAIILKTAKVKNIQEIALLEIKQRNAVLSKLKKEGLSIRRIARLTGINRGIVLKV